MNVEHPESLAPYQAASSIVSSPELAFVRKWRTAVTSPPADKPLPAVDDWLGTALPFQFRLGDIDSTDLLSRCHPKVETHPLQDGSEQQKIIWTDEDLGIRVTWDLKWLAHYPAVEWLLSFENLTEDQVFLLEDIQDMCLSLSTAEGDQPFCLHAVHGGRSQPDDMMPFTVRLGTGGESNATELGQPFEAVEQHLKWPSQTHLPFFNLETPDRKGVIVGLGTVDSWKASMKADKATLTARVESKSLTLEPGQTTRGHRVLLLFWQGEHLHGQNMFRRMLYEHDVPKLRDQPHVPLVSVNTCFTYHKKGHFLTEAGEKNLMPLVDPFARMGAELFIIDAGWYTNGDQWNKGITGDWRPVAEKYPNGFRPLSEKLKANHMDLGIWFATTRNLDCNRFHKQFDTLVQEQGMTCYRHDMGGHNQVILDLWDELRRKHPDLIWEGCCGGGRNIDLESVRRFHWHQKSDRWGDIESDQCSLYGGNLFLPGGLLNIPTYYTDDYGAWSSFAGQFCLGWHPLDADFPIEQARRQVELYKRIRPLLQGDFYPLTACSVTAPWLGYQFHRVDLDAGLALLFRRDVPGEDAFTVRLGGLDPKHEYEVSLVADGSTRSYSGASLAKGLEVGSPSMPGAELILYSPIK